MLKNKVLGVGKMSLDASENVKGIIKSVVTEPVSVLMRFALDIAKIKIEHTLRNENKHENVLSKVQYGQIDIKALQGLQISGVDMAYTNFPAEYVQRMTELSEKFGAHFAVLEIKPGNIASVAFPAKEGNAVMAALKQIAAEQEEKSAGSLKFKSDVIADEDFELADTVLGAHDIPAFMFKTDGGKALAVVPKEHEQHFDAAMKEIKVLKEKLNDISVTKFTQTQALDKLDYCIEELPATEALELNKSLKLMEYAPAVKFIKNDNSDKITIMYPAAEKDRINEIKSSYLSDRKNADKVLINIIGNDISIDKKSLMISENSGQYFTKVPGMDAYIYFDKSSFSENNSMISGKLDFNAQYNLYDKAGKQISEISGLELAKNYNGKSRFMNKDTQIAYSDTNALEHIELYSASENKLMKIGIDNSDNIRKVLAAQGYNQRTADIILRNINEKMSDEQKEVFAFKSENAIVYSDIPNIDELKTQFNIAQQINVTKAENVTGPASAAVGEKIFVFDRSINKYALFPPGTKIDITAAINNKFGYDYIKSEAAANKVLKETGYNEFDISRIRELGTRPFDTNNLLLHNVRYAKENDTVFIIAEQREKVDFISFDKNVPRVDVERNIIERLGIKDYIAVAEIMHQFDKMDAIQKCTQYKTHNKDITVEMTTQKCCSIIKDGNAIYMPKETINADKIAATFDIDKEMGQRLADSISKAIRSNFSAGENGEKGQKLNEIVKAAADKFKSVTNKSSDSISLDVEKSR